MKFKCRNPETGTELEIEAHTDCPDTATEEFAEKTDVDDDYFYSCDDESKIVEVFVDGVWKQFIVYANMSVTYIAYGKVPE